MAESERLVQFSLLGQEYRFYTGASEEEMEAVLSLVRERIEESGGKGQPGVIPVNKITVLACLNLASSYVKLQNDFELYKKKAETRIDNISRTIGNCIADDTTI